MVDNIQNLKRSSVVNVIFSIQFIEKCYILYSVCKKDGGKALQVFSAAL